MTGTEFADLNVRITADTGVFESGLRRAGGASSDFANRISKTGKSSSGLSGGLKSMSSGLASFGAALSVGGIVAWGAAIASAADNMSDLAKRTDSTVMGLESVRLGAQKNGVEFEKLTAGLGRLQKVIGSELSGGGPSVLADIGLDAGKLAGMDVDQKFVAIGEALDKYNNKAQKAAVLSRIFGRAGAEMVDVFEDGGASIKNAGTFIEGLGISLDSSEIAAMGDRFDELNTSLRLLGVVIVNEIAPAFQDWAIGIGVVIKAIGGMNAAVDESGKKISGWGILYKMVTEAPGKVMDAVKGGRPTTKEGWEKLEGGGIVGAGRRALAEGNVEEHIDEQYAENLKKLHKALEDGRISHDQYKESVAAAYEEKKKMLSIEQPTAEDLTTTIEVPEWTKEQKEAMAATEAAAKQSEAAENAIVASLSEIGDKIRDKMITPMQEYEQQTAQLSAALERGIITQEEFAFAMTDAGEALQKNDPAFAAATDMINKYADAAKSAMGKYADEAQTIRSEMDSLRQMSSLGLIDDGTLTRGLDELQESLNELDPAFVAAKDHFDDLKSAAEGMYESTRTPMEKTMEEMAKLHEMAAAGLIDDETFGRGFEKIQSEFDKQNEGAGADIPEPEKRNVFAGEASGAGGMAGLMAASAIGGANSVENQQLNELKLIREALQRGGGMGQLVGVWA